MIAINIILGVALVAQGVSAYLYWENCQRISQLNKKIQASNKIIMEERGRILKLRKEAEDEAKKIKEDHEKAKAIRLSSINGLGDLMRD